MKASPHINQTGQANGSAPADELLQTRQRRREIAKRLNIPDDVLGDVPEEIPDNDLEAYARKCGAIPLQGFLKDYNIPENEPKR